MDNDSTARHAKRITDAWSGCDHAMPDVVITSALKSTRVKSGALDRYVRGTCSANRSIIWAADAVAAFSSREFPPARGKCRAVGLFISAPQSGEISSPSRVLGLTAPNLLINSTAPAVRKPAVVSSPLKRVRDA